VFTVLSERVLGEDVVKEFTHGWDQLFAQSVTMRRSKVTSR
jgi:hypothetical protein